MRNNSNKNYELIIQKNSFILIILALNMEKFISIPRIGGAQKDFGMDIVIV